MRKEKINQVRKLLEELGIDDEYIEDRLSVHEDLEDWTPVTAKELEKMSNKQLLELKSYCWHDGKFRCDTIGITDLEIKKEKNRWTISFSDDNGDPSFDVDPDHPINNVGDGEWNYGLFKKYEPLKGKKIKFI